MKIQIEIPNDVKRGRAITGSLYIDNDGNSNFRMWRKRQKKTSLYKRLSHGRVSVDVMKTRVMLTINHDEGVDAVKAISTECVEATNWLQNKSK